MSNELICYNMSHCILLEIDNMNNLKQISASCFPIFN